MWTLDGFMQRRAQAQAEKQRKEAAHTKNAVISRDILGMPASPKAAKAQAKALKKNRPPATTDQKGNPYPPITQVSPGKNQKKRQKWQDSANKTRTRPQP